MTVLNLIINGLSSKLTTLGVLYQTTNDVLNLIINGLSSKQWNLEI